MKINFKDINYLKVGNTKQKETYRIITEHNFFEILKDYNPIIVGTIPINIDVKESDVDIVLQTNDFDKLNSILHQNFSNHPKFQIKSVENSHLICNFNIDNIPFEFYARNLATEKQYGYLHMIKEYEILQSKSKHFAEQIRELKIKGMKTEPAFCELLNINGDPYIELLKYKI